MPAARRPVHHPHRPRHHPPPPAPPPSPAAGNGWNVAEAERPLLEAVAREFGAGLPRHAITSGRLHTFTTRSWTRPPGDGETYAVIRKQWHRGTAWDRGTARGEGTVRGDAPP